MNGIEQVQFEEALASEKPLKIKRHIGAKGSIWSQAGERLIHMFDENLDLEPKDRKCLKFPVPPGTPKPNVYRIKVQNGTAQEIRALTKDRAEGILTADARLTEDETEVRVLAILAPERDEPDSE